MAPQFSLADAVPHRPMAEPSVGELIRASAGRRDVQAAAAQVKAAELNRGAAVAELYPALSLHDVCGAVYRQFGAVRAGSKPGVADFLSRPAGNGRPCAQRAGDFGGHVLLPGSLAILAILAMMPVVGFLVSRVDARYLIAFGLWFWRGHCCT